MEADWEVGDRRRSAGDRSPLAGFVDLRAAPERIVEIAEAAAFPPLAGLLLALNAPESPVWTSKCDRWEPEPGRWVSILICCRARVSCLPSGGKPRRFAGSM